MRNFRIYLGDIIDAMEKIESFTAGLSYEEFRSDEKTISAVRDKLIVIGEAAKKIPAEVRDAHPEIAWQSGRYSLSCFLLWHFYFRPHSLPGLASGISFTSH